MIQWMALREIPRKAFTLIQWTSHEYTMEYQISHDIPWIYQCFPDLFTIFVGYISYIPIFPMNQRSRESFSDHRTQALAGRPNEGVAPDPPSPSWSGEPKGGCLGWGREWNTGKDWKCWDAELIFIGLILWFSWLFRMPCWKCLISTRRFVRSLYTATNVVWQAAMSHSPGVVRTIGLWTEGNDHKQNKFHCSHLYYILFICYSCCSPI